MAYSKLGLINGTVLDETHLRHIEAGIDSATSFVNTITLTAAGWSSKTQTVTAPNVTANNIVFPVPVDASYAAYCEADVFCTAQAAGSLTFTCATKPSVDLSVSIVVIN